MTPPPENNHLEGLRVLGFCDYFTESAGGGAERVTLEVYRRLIARGAEVCVVSAVPGAKDGRSEIEGVPTHTVPARSLTRLLQVQFSISRGLRRTAEAIVHEAVPHVIHASSIHFQGSITAARLARRHGIPLVTTAHLGSLTALSPVTRLATSTYEQAAGRYILRSSRDVIAVSKATAAHVSQLGAKRVTIVPNGVDHDRFTPSPNRLERPIQIVFVGRLIGNKGPDVALAAFASLNHPSARLTFVGDGPLRKRLESAAEHLGGAVRFTGHCQDVATIMGSAHILVRPSQTEGRSLAMLEAMAAEVCVVASDIEANRELIRPGETGLLHRAGDSSNLAAMLQSLVIDPPKMRAIAGAGRKIALEHSWDRCTASTGRVLAAAVTGAGGR